MKKYFSLYVFILCGLFYTTDTAALSYTCDTPDCNNMIIGGASKYNQMFIINGGIASGIVFLSGGEGAVNDNGIINDSIINGGNIRISGTANNLTLNNGRVNLSDVASINNLTGKDADGKAYTFSKAAEEKDNLTIHKGINYNLSKNTEVTNITVLNGGLLRASDGNHIITDSIINAGGEIDLSSSTAMSNVMICQSAGQCIVLNKAAGEIDGFEVVKGMKIYAEKDETVKGIVINGGNLTLNNGTSQAIGTILNSGTIHNHISITDTIVNGGVLLTFANSITENTIVNGGTIYIYDNSIIKNAQFIFNDASKNYTFNKRADQKDKLDIRERMHYSPEGTTTDNIINGGQLSVLGKAFNTVLNQGTVKVRSFVDGIVANGGNVIGDVGSQLKNINMKSGSILNLQRTESIVDGKQVVSTVELSGDIAIDKGAILSGTYDYNNFFTGSKEANLILINGINNKFGNALYNNQANKTLTFADENYTISADGRNASTAVSGWDKIAVRNEDKNDSSLHLASDMSAKIFEIGKNSTLFTEGHNLKGGLLNTGTLDIRAGSGFNEMNLSGDYSSNGGILNIKADPEINKSDKLIIGGDVLGTTKVYIERTTDKTADGQIYFAEALNDNLQTAGDFEIYRMNGSSLVWKTYYDQDKKSWYTGKELVEPTEPAPDPGTDPKPDPNPDTDPNPQMPIVILPERTEVVGEFMAYAGLVRVGFEQNSDLLRRLNNHPQYSSRYGMNSRDYGYGWRGWVNPLYRTISNKELFAYEADVSGTDFGFDVQTDSCNSYGLFFSYRKGKYDLDGNGEAYYSAVGSEIDINSYMGGLYYHHRNGKSFLNTSVYGGIQKAELSSDDGVNSKTTGKEFGAGVEVGLIFRPSESTRLEPSMSIRYSLMDYDAVKDDYGKKTEYDIQRRTEVELGLKASKEWPLDEGNAEIYVKGAAIQSSYNGDNLKIGEIENIEATEDGTYGVGEIGVSANTDSGLSFSASASQTFGSDYNDTSFNINLAVSL